MRGFDLATGVAVGAAWVAAFGGAYLAFNALLPHGLAAAISAGVLGAVPGFVIVVFLESARKLFDIAEEQKKQTEILEKLLEKISDYRS